VAVTVLVAVTVAAGAWYFLGRASGEADASGFVDVEHRYATAAWALHYTPLIVRQISDFDSFNAAVDERALEKQRSLAGFDRIAKTEQGEAAALARESVNLAEEGLRAVAAFREAIIATNNLAAAHDAIAVLERVVDELEANAAQWRRL
jgi:hypothetical protein